ncbi:MAG: ankyrin repeat protein [Rickettsiaceae bacterium]|jgi:ankyrin repeat protein|nr:ankyrin repeat protein [Rickettsiaceae bacterium]
MKNKYTKLLELFNYLEIKEIDRATINMAIFKIINDDSLNKIEALEILKESGANFNEAFYLGMKAINVAIIRQDTEIVQYLLDNGVTTNCTDLWGNTPLHAAVIADHAGIINLLLSLGADIEARDESGNTPFDYAFSENHKEAIDTLLQGQLEDTEN